MKSDDVIFDRGYNAVRQMAKEMVNNGATLADILFHANQLWHEFKAQAWSETRDPKVQAGIQKSGVYMDQYDHEATQKLILADKSHVTFADAGVKARK